MKVRGKAMNRTALGIFNAYLQLHPKSTLSQLKAAFPDSLYVEVEGGFFNTIKPVGVFQTKEIIDGLPAKNLQQCHFMKEEEIITTSDGVKICVTGTWGRNALDRLIKHVEQFGIIVEDIREGESFKRGEYEITRLEPEANYMMYYIIAGIVLLLIVLFFIFGGKKDEPVVEKPVPAVVAPAPKNEVVTFNNILFNEDVSVLKNDVQADLTLALNMFSNNPKLKVKIIGHTDKTGKSQQDYNLNLS